MTTSPSKLEKYNIFLGCLSVFFGSMAGVSAIAVTVFLIYRPSVTEYLNAHFGVLAGNSAPIALSNLEAKVLTKMLENGAILSQADFLDNLTSFYSNIIAYLLGTIAVLAVLAVMYVVGVSKSHAEQMVEREVKNVLSTRAFMAELTQEVHKYNRELLDPLMNDYRDMLSENADELSSLLVRVNNFEQKIEQQIETISQTVAELDNSEEIQAGEATTVGV